MKFYKDSCETSVTQFRFPVFGPFVKILLLLYLLGFLATCFFPDVTIRWFSQRNHLLFSHLHLWTIVTGMLLTFCIGNFFFVVFGILAVICPLENLLKPRYFHLFFLMTSLTGCLLVYFLSPYSETPQLTFFFPLAATSGGLCHLYRKQYGHYFFFKVRIDYSILIGFFFLLILPLIFYRLFLLAAICLLLFGEGYLLIRLLEWTERKNIRPKTVSKNFNHIEID